MLVIALFVTLTLAASCPRDYTDSGCHLQKSGNSVYPQCTFCGYTYKSRFTKFKCLAPRKVKKQGGAAFQWLEERVQRTFRKGNLYIAPPPGEANRKTRCCLRHDSVIACDVVPDWSGRYTEDRPDWQKFGKSAPLRTLVVKHIDRAKNWKDMEFTFGQNGMMHQTVLARWQKDNNGRGLSFTYENCEYSIYPKAEGDASIININAKDIPIQNDWQTEKCPWGGIYFMGEREPVNMDDEPQSMEGLEA